MAGRPRSSAVDDAILRSTFELVEQHGYRGASIEGIAAHSGVAKQTIYRRYSNKGQLFLDILSAFAAEQMPVPDTGSLRGDLAELLQATFAAQQGASGVLNRALATEALQDEVFAAQLWDRLIDQRRQVVRGLLGRARARGEVQHPDDEFLIDLVFGPMWYRLLFGRQQLDSAYALQLAAAVSMIATNGSPPLTAREAPTRG